MSDTSTEYIRAKYRDDSERSAACGCRYTPYGYSMCRWHVDFVREVQASLDLGAQLRKSQNEITSLARPEDVDAWLELADVYGRERTRVAVAMGLTPVEWGAVARLPDAALDFLKREARG